MGKTKSIIWEGEETTVATLAKKWRVPYHTAYKRIRQQQRGANSRPSKKPVTWVMKNGKRKTFESISALARELGYSRQYISRLVKKQENK